MRGNRRRRPLAPRCLLHVGAESGFGQLRAGRQRTRCSVPASGGSRTGAAARRRARCQGRQAPVQRLPGRPYIRSRLKLSKCAAAVRSPRLLRRRRGCAERFQMRRVEALDAERGRLTPAARKAANLSASTVPGLASSVISAPRATSGRRMPDRRQQRSRPSPENRLGVPPPKKMLDTLRPQTSGSADFKIGDQRRDVGGLGMPPRSPCELKSQYGHFCTHHGNVHVQESGSGDAKLQASGRPPPCRGRIGMMRAGGLSLIRRALSRSIRCCGARPRCERRFFSAESSSAAVTPRSGSGNTGRSRSRRHRAACRQSRRAIRLRR